MKIKDLIIRLNEISPPDRVIITMINKGDFDTPEEWYNFYKNRLLIDWNYVRDTMISFFGDKEHIDRLDDPFGSTSQDLAVFLNKYFDSEDDIVATIFKRKDFPEIDKSHWGGFTSLINDDFDTTFIKKIH